VVKTFLLYWSSNGFHSYIYIESDYGTLQSTRALCALRSIFNFKLEMINLNRSI
jgi:hypothetical protein